MTYRILSFDGGGIRGQYITTLLRRLEEQLPGWSEEADLLAGASIGAVLALGLANRHSPNELDSMFRQHGPQLFQPANQRLPTRLLRYIRAGYSTDPLKGLLKDFCGETRLGELGKWVVIPAFKLDNGQPDPHDRSWEPKIFHNLRTSDKEQRQLPIRQVVLCATATPTLFPSFEGYVDGGLVANNPSIVALAHLEEAINQGDGQQSDQKIILFSIGTGFVQRFIKERKNDWGYIQWQKHIIDLMNSGSIQLADRQCRQFLRDRYHRLCPTLREKINASDKHKGELLVKMAESVDLSSTITWLKEQWLPQLPGQEVATPPSMASYGSV